jgi:hypothetical protein
MVVASALSAYSHITTAKLRGTGDIPEAGERKPKHL